MVKAIILLCCALVLSVSPAIACGVMDKADPRVGSTVDATDHITLTFSQTIVPAFSTVKVTDAAGNEAQAGKPVNSGNDTVMSLKTSAPLAPGKYKVSWNVLWLDCGSKTQGDYKFTVR